MSRKPYKIHSHHHSHDDEEPYEQESGVAANEACPGPISVWVFAATALSCSASLDFLSALIRGAIASNRAAVVSLLTEDNSG
jgi:hypothetical protein